MMNACRECGPDAGTSGDDPHSVSKSVVRTVRNMLMHPEHKPRSPPESRESS